MAVNPHPLVDRITRHLRNESSKPRKDGEDERMRAFSTDDYAKEPSSRIYGRAQQTQMFNPTQVPNSDFRLSHAANETTNNPAPRNSDDDGRSVSSNLKEMSLQNNARSPASNKRAAADPAHGHPKQFRSNSTGGNISRVPAPRPNHGAFHQDPLSSAMNDLSNQDSPPHARTPARSAGLIPGDKFRDSVNSPFGYQVQSNPTSKPEGERLASSSTGSSPIFNSLKERNSSMLLQPETRPITQEQLVNEVKGIYAGLVMVEKKCVEIDQQQSSTTNKLSDEQWQALTALHRTLLHEHHDFFLASQHPSSSPALRRLATKYAMPARMWRHGIHSYLELLRHRLPDSLEHMLTFVYLAYSMMALLMESVSSFEETWIECLGDLARYRMAIEEADLRDREVWSGVARMWYNKAADKSPNVGRIQHHLAVLARPNIIQQLFYYSKALVCVVPFPNARESVMLLFNPFLEVSEIASQRYPSVEAAFVKAHGFLFVYGSVLEYRSLMEQFLSVLDNHIGRVTAKFRVQGPELACSLCAATFDFGRDGSFLLQAFRDNIDRQKSQLEPLRSSPGQEEHLPEDPRAIYRDSLEAMQAEWDLIGKDLRILNQYDVAHVAADLFSANPHSSKDSTTKDATFSGSHDAAAIACQSLGQTTALVSQRIGDKNVMPYMHVTLAYLYGLAYVPRALMYVEGHVHWENISVFLNTLGRSGAIEARFEGTEFPQQSSGTGRQLPEDFVMRGMIWAQHYFPTGFFDGDLADEEERSLELPSHAAPRAERCLWLGIRLASLNRWLRYDTQSKQFSVTEYAQSLEGLKNPSYTFDTRSQTLSAERDLEADVRDVDD